MLVDLQRTNATLGNWMLTLPQEPVCLTGREVSELGEVVAR
jgi:hypothetical protein